MKAVVYGGSKENYKSLDYTLVTESPQFWKASRQITLSGGNYVTHVDRINQFITYSYNYCIMDSFINIYFP